MKKGKVFHWLKSSTIFGLLLTLLSACSTNDLAMFNTKGPIARGEAHLIITSLLLMFIVVIPVIFMAIFFSIRYREGNNATYKPNWSHNNKLEAVCWLAPIVIIAILGVMMIKTSYSLAPERPIVSNEKTIHIQAVSLKWSWLFIYPEEGIATLNRLEIPVGVPVKFSITSDSAMNSLWIPQLAGQIYAMNGMNMALNLMADEAGVYRGGSANFSGAGFTEMNFNTHAVPKDEFTKWVVDTKNSSNILSKDVYAKLSEDPIFNKDPLITPQFKRVAPQDFSVPKDNETLFHDIVMKYMLPTDGNGAMEGMDHKNSELKMDMPSKSTKPNMPIHGELPATVK